MTSSLYELHGQSYVPLAAAPADAEWPMVSDPQAYATLVIKNDDLFLVTDPLGNVVNPVPAGPHKARTVTGLFCRDTRFLSRSELQIEQRSPILLGNQCDRSYALHVHCTTPPH